MQSNVDAMFDLEQNLPFSTIYTLIPKFMQSNVDAIFDLEQNLPFSTIYTLIPNSLGDLFGIWSRRVELVISG